MVEGFLSTSWINGIIMCKDMRGLRMAAKAAEQSGYKRFRHGAALIRGGSVLNFASNSGNHTAFGQRFRSSDVGKATHHAETACVLGLDKSITHGGTIYAARINKRGEWRMSKPCSMCHEVMKFVGVKKVVYTIGPQEWGSYRFYEGEE